MARPRNLTPEARKELSAAGERGALARWGKPEDRRPGVEPPPMPALTPEQERAAAAVGPKLPAPGSWREAYQRQQAGVAALKREKLQLEIDAMRRERVPIVEVREFLARARAVMLRELATLIGLADKIPEARPHQIEAMRRELAAFAEATRKSISETDL